MKYLPFAVIASMLLGTLPAHAQVVRDIVFPVQGGGTFTDDFADARYQHTHEGNDIHAAKMTPALAAVDGEVEWLTETQQVYGWMLTLRDADGYTYNYIHINNDTPGTDDGVGGYSNAFGPGIAQGARVTRGQVVGYVGDSGNAENIGPHLHFEIRLPDGTAIDPYQSLLLAQGLKSGAPYVREVEMSASPTINVDRGITLQSTLLVACSSGSLIRSSSSKAVYYCGADGKRYVFPNEKTYFTWYADFSRVVTVADEEMSGIMIGGNVTYRPGVKLVKTQIDPKVYAVAGNGTLRPVATAAVASALYGSSWAKQVDDIPEAFFTNYKIGEPITSVQ